MPALQVSAGGVSVPRARSSENQRRAGQGPEYELLDTGVFDDDRYFDIFIEYAKADPEDIAIRITAHNRGPDAAPLHILPTLWFRNTWAWGAAPLPEPTITCERARRCVRWWPTTATRPSIRNMPASLPARTAASCTARRAPALFTDNETNGERAYGPGNTSRTPYTKDAFHRAICERDADGGPTRRPRHQGGAALPATMVPARRLGHAAPAAHRQGDHRMRSPTSTAIIDARKAEADTFYAGLAPREATADERLVQRRALAGLLWTQAELPLRRRALARRRQSRAAAAAVAAQRSATATGATSTRCA